MNGLLFAMSSTNFNALKIRTNEKYLSVKLVGQILWIIFQSRNHEYHKECSDENVSHFKCAYWKRFFCRTSHYVQVLVQYKLGLIQLSLKSFRIYTKCKAIKFICTRLWRRIVKVKKKERNWTKWYWGINNFSFIVGRWMRFFWNEMRIVLICKLTRK